MCTEVYVPGFVPQARNKDLKQMENPRFKSFDEYLWFYFPKGSEQTFFRHGDPGEIACYLVDRALTTRTKEQFAEWLRKF